MVKIISSIVIVILLSGCSTLMPTKTEIKEVKTPVLVCPEPPAISKPNLLIDQLTEEDKNDPGKVAQFYKGTVKQLTEYVKELEAIIEQYDKTSKKYDELRRIVDEQFSENGKSAP